MKSFSAHYTDVIYHCASGNIHDCLKKKKKETQNKQKTSVDEPLCCFMLC